MTHGAGQAITSQACNESLALPMPEGSMGFQPLTFQASPTQPHHLGVCAGFVDEDKAMGIVLRDRLPALDPGLTRISDVRPFLFAGQQGFF
jgi:hypothetical protein